MDEPEAGAEAVKSNRAKKSKDPTLNLWRGLLRKSGKHPFVPGSRTGAAVILSDAAGKVRCAVFGDYSTQPAVQEQVEGLANFTRAHFAMETHKAILEEATREKLAQAAAAGLDLSAPAPGEKRRSLPPSGQLKRSANAACRALAAWYREQRGAELSYCCGGKYASRTTVLQHSYVVGEDGHCGCRTDEQKLAGQPSICAAGRELTGWDPAMPFINLGCSSAMGTNQLYRAFITAAANKVPGFVSG